MEKKEKKENIEKDPAQIPIVDFYSKLKEIISGIIPFCAKVINSRTYQFFGTFHLESVYNMKIFDKLIVSKY